MVNKEDRKQIGLTVYKSSQLNARQITQAFKLLFRLFGDLRMHFKKEMEDVKAGKKKTAILTLAQYQQYMAKITADPELVELLNAVQNEIVENKNPGEE